MSETRIRWKEAAWFGVPWEEAYGYSQAIRAGDTIYISGQLSHDAGGRLIAPAPLDEFGRPTSYDNMEAQMRATYASAARLLAKFDASLDNVVEETIYALDVDAAFVAAGPVRKEAYGSAQPQCASTLVGVTRLALPEQLVEISMTAVVPAARVGTGP